MNLAIISAISIPISILSLGVAFSSFRRTAIVSRAQLFISLRSRFLEIHKGLPDQLEDPNWEVQEGTSEWRAIERYWYNAFDEWFVTTKIFSGDREELWKIFFSHAIQSALKHPSMIKVVKK
jgi:hypothetical protein